MDEEAARLVTAVKDRIAENVMVLLDGLGRAAPLDSVLLYTWYYCENHIEILQDYRVEFNLLELIDEYDAFYYFVHGGCEYVSLSRNYHYVNTRLSLFLREVNDKSRESLLKCRVLKRAANAPVHGRNWSSFERPSEYDFAKCALATLEILSTVRSSAQKTRRKLPYKCLLTKCAKMSTLAKAALKAAYDGEWERQLGYFLGLYRNVFMEDSVTSQIFDLMTDGLEYSAEMDLLWSYAGICICKGLTDIAMLIRELKVFIKKAKLNYILEVDEAQLKSYLEARNDMYMLPGDGSVWQLQPLPTSAKVKGKIADLFVQYLTGDNAFNYMECYSVLKYLSPDIARYLKVKSPIAVASFLYSDAKTFAFTNGLIGLNADASSTETVRKLTRIHVPVGNADYIHLDAELNCTLTEVFGCVVEVAVHSALVYFPLDELKIAAGQILTPDAIRGYCHKGKTKVNDREVEDFRKHLKLGDLVKTSVSTYRHKGIEFPFHYLITSLVKVEATVEMLDPSHLNGAECKLGSELKSIKACL